MKLNRTLLSLHQPKIKRHFSKESFRALLLVSIAGLYFVCPSFASAQQKNVLFIAVDDLRPELGCYGSQMASTPHIDKFAQRSMMFRQHFVQVPTCGASRYALLTGRSPASSGVTTGNAAAYQGRTAFSTKELAGAQTMPELFRRNQYHTILIGKISHTADGLVYEYNGTGDGRRELPLAWDELATPLGSWKRGWGVFFAYADGSHREDGLGHNDLMQFVAEKDDDLPDGMMATTAIEKLQEMAQSKQPFFLGLGFFKPHLPFVATRQDWEAFASTDLPGPPHPDKPDSPHWHNSGEFFKYDFPFEKDRPLSKAQVGDCRRAYLACVRYTDRQVGRVLQALQDSGLAQSTIVVLWGDHGWNLGDSGMWAKHTPFERAVRSPLIIHDPGGKTAGQATDALVETIDIYPTLMELCDFEETTTDAPLDGMSLVPILNDPDFTVRDHAVSYWKNAVTVRTNSHRLIATFKNGQYGGYELYDRTTEFDPVQNLAGQYPAIVTELSAKLPEVK